ncbi:C40 family peptidase [Quisquiliibacterium transsilvanicum]|uniref:NlpC/P60 domain-containing protein n=1 Tax=Quisquiliibacterium transsilvanicum TaxID=1549638 RepID=A0A7W8HDU9_9BURK|nr:hypothetical protein [Quisquiliibacterium transsilvanicum]
MPTPALPRPYALRLPLRALTAALLACAAAFAAPPDAIAETAAPVEARGLADQLVSRAMGLLGVPYKWGGNAPETGLDCSGLVRHVFEDAAGLVLPRRAMEMSRAGAPVGRGELQPGDLVFFNTLRRAFSHVGIYIGDGRFVHAPSSGGKVRVERIAGSYWANRFNGGRRLIDSGDDGDAGPAIAAAGLGPSAAALSAASAGVSSAMAGVSSAMAGVSSAVAGAASGAAGIASAGVYPARNTAQAGARQALGPAPVPSQRTQPQVAGPVAFPFDTGY